MSHLYPVPIPHPPAKPVIGNLLDIDPENAIGSLVTLMQRYGPIVKLSIIGKERIFLGSQRLVHEISDQSRFEKLVVGALKEARNVAGDGKIEITTDALLYS